MGYLSGRVSWERFAVGGKAEPFTEKHVEVLEKNAVRKASPHGFTGGEHIFDLEFSLEKNLVNDALFGGFRVDTHRVPAVVKNGWLAIELADRARDNPSGFPTRKQKAEAREAVEERCAAEIEDGKHLTHKAVPFLWDSRSETLYIGTSSESMIDRFVPFFEQAFDRTLKRIAASEVAYLTKKNGAGEKAFDDLAPAAFFGAANKSYSVSWLGGNAASRDYLGNEFLLWLWWTVEENADSIRLPDDSTVAVMMSRKLNLECPLAETGKESFSHESPIRLPESKHGVRLGKLPRKTGLTLIRHDEQYDLSLAAETLGVASAALPKLDSETFAGYRQDRVDQVRHLAETIDLLFATFVKRRLSSDWPADLKRIRGWLSEDE